MLKIGDMVRILSWVGEKQKLSQDEIKRFRRIKNKKGRFYLLEGLNTWYLEDELKKMPSSWFIWFYSTSEFSLVFFIRIYFGIIF